MASEHSEERCPYCQGKDFTRLPESDALVNVYRCLGCGTQFSLGRLRDGDEPAEQIP